MLTAHPDAVRRWHLDAALRDAAPRDAALRDAALRAEKLRPMRYCGRPTTVILAVPPFHGHMALFMPEVTATSCRPSAA